jgi:hypothetical protein
MKKALLISAAFLLFLNMINAAIIYVDTDATGSSSGSDWTNAYTILQDALDNASSGDEIWVAAGTYYPSTEVGGSGTRFQSFKMVDGVSIYGGFAGTESALSERTDYLFGGANETILSGDLNNDDVISGINTSLVITNKSENCYHIFRHDADYTLTSSAVLDGFTLKGGNSSGSDGSGVDNGGAISNMGTDQTPTINNCYFIGNTGNNNGGAIFNNTGCNSTISNCSFVKNVAAPANESVDGTGGAISNNGANPAITNCLFYGNQAGDDADDLGGAIYNYSSIPEIINCTFIENSSYSGGGIYNHTNADATISNCIIWGNIIEGGAGSQVRNYNSDPTFTTCNIQGGWDGSGVANSSSTPVDGSGNIDADAKFVGSTKNPDHPFTIYGDSPCVDVGNDASNSESYDIRGVGFDRKLSGTDGAAGTIDIGAYEYHFNSDPASSGRHYVDTDAVGSNDGYNWANAFTTFQSALNVAVSGDQIWVAAGTYKPSSAYNLTDEPRFYHFEMIEGVEIYGGFAGTENESTQRTDFGIGQANETILSGDIGSPGDDSDNCYHVFFHEGLALTNAAVLDGFTISKGFAILSPIYKGGAMYNDASSPKLRNCIITENFAFYGGGIFNNNYSSPSLINCLFVNNSASIDGGALYNNVSASPPITNCTFSGNSADRYGGALVNGAASSPLVINSIFWNNTAGTSSNEVKNLTPNCTPSFSYCDIAGGVGSITYAIDGGNNIDSNPKFDGLSVDYPYAITGVSPCADAGDNTTNNEIFDIRGEGFSRKLSKTDGAAGTIDIGAYEYKLGTDAYSGPVYVDYSASGNNDGSSWANAFSSLQDALDEVVTGQDIWVAKGTYYPSVEVGGMGDRSKAFQMVNGVTIYGGFAGTETATTERTDYSAGEINETILSGDIGTIGVNTDNCYHVIHHPTGSGINNTAVIDGFSITKGYADGTNYDNDGAGMNNDNASPTVRNCIFSDNHATGSGGGLRNFRSSQTIITNCTFTNNSAVMGGGILNSNTYSYTTISNSTFTFNSAAGFGGGAIGNESTSHSNISNCVFSENTTVGYAGGAIEAGQFSIINCTSCTFFNNTTDKNGGAVGLFTAGGEFVNCLFYNNSATGTTSRGGAIEQNSSTNDFSLINCTFSGNSSTIVGGGVSLTSTSSGTRTIINTIAWNNYAAGSPEIYISNEGVSIGYTCIKGGIGSITNATDAGNNVDINPHFSDAGIDNYTLAYHSSCKNVGDNSANTESYDIRGEGHDRIQESTIDMGAFEYTSVTDPTYALSTWTGETDTDWNVDGNWSGNDDPTPFYNITIPDVTNDPVIGQIGTASCSDLSISEGATLAIQSGASGTGSLITNGSISNSGAVYMQRYISDGQWHLISIPTTGITSDTFLGDYLQSWDETTGEWSEIIDPVTELSTNTGYSLWGTAKATTYTFTGTPLSGEQSKALTYTNGVASAYDGANLLGNPYPSSIDWSGLDDTWGAVYYYNGSAYVSWNNGSGSGSQFVPPMQGFFIVVAQAGTFELSNDNRTHNGASGYYKSEEELSNGIILQASNGSYIDELHILFSESASESFDLQNDAWKFLSGTPGISEIYSFCDEKMLSIDVRPETQTIQLGFTNDQPGIYSIGISEIADISEATLEDTKTNTFHDLTKGNYEFTWDLNDDEKRFKLHLNAVGIEETQISESNILIYADGQQIFIKNVTGAVEHGRASLSVTDLLGRVVLQQNINESELTTIPVNLKTGVYLVALQNGDKVIIEKVFIK